MSTDLIVVKQLPIIEEQLLQVKARIQEMVSSALTLACTEETVKTVKEVRSELNKEFNDLEERRKSVKKAILTPYDKFESIYRECVTDLFKPADEQLKSKIAEVENGLKEQRRTEAEAFFDEYAKSKGIDFVTFERSGINVTLSVSKKSLKDQGRTFINKVVDELALIDTQDHKAEILVEYKKTLNVASSITSVIERMKAVEAERARVEAAQKAADERAAAARNIDNVVETEQIAAAPLSAPTMEPDDRPSDDAAPPESSVSVTLPQPDRHITVTFSVTDTRERLVILREFMKNGGYSYVSQ